MRPKAGGKCQPNDSFQSIVASSAATKAAIALAQTGMTVPSIVIGQAKMKRTSCKTAISPKNATVIVVNGFMVRALSELRRLYGPPLPLHLNSMQAVQPEEQNGEGR